MEFENLYKLSTQDKQVYAAKCLENYCDYFKIEDKVIDSLIDHLFAMKVCYNLAKWERIGARLELTGRGDAIPESLLSKIPENKLSEFVKLVDDCVEVGLTDMYGADTDNPYKYLKKCVEILQLNGIDLPVYPRILKTITGMEQF